MDLLQVSLLINKQTGGKKKKSDREMEGERDLWTTRSETALAKILTGGSLSCWWKNQSNLSR